MSRADKALAKMGNNPQGWRIEQLKSLADRYGVAYTQNGTSHVVFRYASGRMLSVPADRPIKAVYVKQFHAMLKESLHDLA